MLVRAELIRWTIAASLLASHNLRAVTQDVAEALVDGAISNTLAETDNAIRTTLSMGVSITWMEGKNLLNIKGDGGESYCFAQINLPHGARTSEGWTGDDLLADASKCATVMYRLIKTSVRAQSHPGECELCVYARGPNWRDKCIHHEEGRAIEGRCLEGETPYARTLSDNRVALAHRLIRDVPLELPP